MDQGARADRRASGRWTAPWWLVTIAWVLVAALGAWLIARPLSSLTVLVLLLGVGMILVGVAEIAGAREAPQPTPILAALGAAWFVLGALVLVFRGFTTSAIGVVVAVALLVSGAVRLVAALSRREHGWITAAVLGAAGVVFGLIALGWPDLTLIVVAIAFGGWLVVVGASRAWAALVERFGGPRHGDAVDDEGDEPSGRRPRRARWLATVGAVVVLALALGAGWLSLRLNQASPRVDGFYAAPVSTPAEPGVLVRAESFPTGGNGIPDSAEAWRILYTTTRDEGEPAVASALVVAASDRPSGPRPMVAWAHGTTGFAEPCAPSILPEPFTAGAMPALDEVLDRGWILVASDYVGLGTQGPHPYLIGQGEGRSVLDAMRAARQLRTVSIADRAVIWGHSQGGHAALWAGGLHDDYAAAEPLDGVAAYAPASDLPALVDNLDEVRGGQIFAAFTFSAYEAIYDDVDLRRVVTGAGQGFVRPLSQRCLAEPATLASVLSALAIGDDVSVLRPDATSGAFGARLDENVPRGRIDVPLFIGQGGADPLVLPGAQAGYAAARCADGQELEYREYPRADHLAVTTDPTAVADLLAFTEARFAGEDWTSGCEALPVD